MKIAAGHGRRGGVSGAGGVGGGRASEEAGVVAQERLRVQTRRQEHELQEQERQEERRRLIRRRQEPQEQQERRMIRSRQESEEQQEQRLIRQQPRPQRWEVSWSRTDDQTRRLLALNPVRNRALCVCVCVCARACARAHLRLPLRLLLRCGVVSVFAEQKRSEEMLQSEMIYCYYC